jgi:osmotically-inducible protein OsmY
MRTDGQIKQDILDELVFQPNIDETQIGVIVEDGVVTLTGIVNDFHKKISAENVVKKIKGVKAVAEDIEVKYGAEFQKTDKEIAKAIVRAFEWNTAVPEDKITIEVQNGWVTLLGEVEFWYQKDAARCVINGIIGVKRIINNIEIKPAIKPDQVKEKITSAFRRLADIEAENITIEVDENIVVLRGKVHSLKEKEEATKTAYYIVGINKVVNKLVVTGTDRRLLYGEFGD